MCRYSAIRSSQRLIDMQSYSNLELPLIVCRQTFNQKLNDAMKRYTSLKKSCNTVAGNAALNKFLMENIFFKCSTKGPTSQITAERHSDRNCSFKCYKKQRSTPKAIGGTRKTAQ